MTEMETLTGTLPVVVVAGFSGAGMSTALQVFEDSRFVTADGLPPSVLPEMARLLRDQAKGHAAGVALGVRMPHEGLYEELMQALHASPDGERPVLLFLSADPAVILKRYATTRRPHPLERDGVGLEKAMAEEVARLAPVREAADIVIDTSSFSIHDLRRVLQKRWRKTSEHLRALKVNIVSFGFKYGVPKEADLVFDLRFLPNPFFEEKLKSLSGKDKPVAEYVFSSFEAREFKKRFIDFIRYLLPLYDQEGRYRLTIAIGCTGGRHRSVAMAEALDAELKKDDYLVSLEHRHMELG